MDLNTISNQGSRNTRADKSPQDMATARSQSRIHTAIEELPQDVLYLIAQEVTDIITLKNLAKAYPAFFNILKQWPALLKNCHLKSLGPALVDAYAIISVPDLDNCKTTEQRSEELYAHFTWYSWCLNRHTLSSDSLAFQLSDVKFARDEMLVSVLIAHELAFLAADRFRDNFNTAVCRCRATGNCRLSMCNLKAHTLSIREYRRFVRAILRYEFLCTAFPACKTAKQVPLEDPAEDIMFVLYLPSEVEEMLCIWELIEECYEFYREELMKQRQADEATTKRLEALDCNRLTAAGLGFFYKVICSDHDMSKLGELLLSQDSAMHAEASLPQAIERIQDEDNMPLTQFLRVWRDLSIPTAANVSLDATSLFKYCSAEDYGSRPIRVRDYQGLRQWGYCMWDRHRLQGVGALEAAKAGQDIERELLGFPLRFPRPAEFVRSHWELRL